MLFFRQGSGHHDGSRVAGRAGRMAVLTWLLGGHVEGNFVAEPAVVEASCLYTAAGVALYLPFSKPRRSHRCRVCLHV